MALQAARDALIQEGRTRISVIGVRGMIWMPKVYSAFSPNHVPRSTWFGLGLGLGEIGFGSGEAEAEAETQVRVGVRVRMWVRVRGRGGMGVWVWV